MLSFENPINFILCALLPLGIYYRHFFPGRGSTIHYAFVNWRGTGFRNPLGLARFGSGVLGVLFWVGFACLLVALTSPVLIQRERVFLSRGVDIMIVLDISPTMSALDSPGVTRFEAAKNVIRSFVQRRRNDPVGLTIFGTEAALRVPPTLDYAYLLENLGQVQLEELGIGTALGMGIGLGALHLNQSTASEKIMILLTDGRQNSGEILPEAAAELARSRGIRIYTIGLGSNRPVAGQVTDPATGIRYYGNIVEHVDVEGLTRIAALTGGEYFSAANPGALESIFQSIDSLERVESRVRVQVYREPIHRIFILLGFLFILADAVLRRLLLKEVV